MTTMQQQAQAKRDEAARHEREKHESFERCDTDGFLSQWASGVNAQKARLEADLIEAGGVWEFPALFDRNGQRVKARLVTTQYGTRWCVQDKRGNAVEWVPAFKTGKHSKLHKLGLREGTELAPGKVDFGGGSGRGTGGCVNVTAIVKRTDGGIPEGAKPWGRGRR